MSSYLFTDLVALDKQVLATLKLFQQLRSFTSFYPLEALCCRSTVSGLIITTTPSWRPNQNTSPTRVWDPIPRIYVQILPLLTYKQPQNLLALHSCWDADSQIWRPSAGLVQPKLYCWSPWILYLNGCLRKNVNTVAAATGVGCTLPQLYQLHYSLRSKTAPTHMIA